jgi:competence CoiA-like predicted nuclease
MDLRGLRISTPRPCSRSVQQRHPQLEVVIDASGRDGQRADILVTSPRSGKRLAIEMQCSPLTDAERRHRHDSYAAV